MLLVATGRIPNSNRLDVAVAGIEVDAHGHIRTDDTYTTSVPGIWALGDLADHYQLKHMANAETRLVRHNLLHPSQPHRRASRGVRPVGCELVIQHEREREQRSPHCRQRLATAGASPPDAAGPAGWRRASASRLRPARPGSGTKIRAPTSRSSSAERSPQLTLT